MTIKSYSVKFAFLAFGLAVAVSPVFADVKSGVDAWTRGEYEAAVNQWRDLAIKGDPDAQFNMGQAYKMGRGVKTDLNVALDWYKRAAAQSHLQAADSYGHLLHYQGKIPESIPYLQASSDRGDPRAQYLLGTELFNGVHIEKDWVRAYALMTRASSAGMTPASRSLAQMDQYIPIEQRQKATVLAGEIEKNSGRIRAAQVAGFPINTTASPKTAKPVTVPPSKVAAAIPPVRPADPPAPSPQPVKAPIVKPVPLKVAEVKPAPVKVAEVKPVAVDGEWRIQLGAFGNETNAKKLWSTLEGKIGDLAGLQPYLNAAGKLTRLQAGPFTTRAAADIMCGKVKVTGQACISVRS